ncbi:MAG TPA: zinc-ribbon domain-containing protein [Planctomycetes bacterium]|nr:zinc-ribbon domain-containing protein [Planctomycetota bacterium]
MKCEACGAEVPENSVYCQKCGERLKMIQSLPQSDQLTAADQAAAPDHPMAEEPAAGQEGSPESAPSGPAATGVDRLREALDRRDTANDQEELLWEGGYSAKDLVGTWFLLAIASVGLVVLAIWLTTATDVSWKVIWGTLCVVLLAAWGWPGLLVLYRKLSVRYRLTTQRFFHEKGILRHVTDRIEVIDMDDISYVQTLIQRFFNVGTIHITSSDRSHPTLTIRGIEEVQKVSAMMDQARRQERIRRGLHIEAV